METDASKEFGVDNETSVVETLEDMDVPEKPEAWDSGSKRDD